MDELDVARSGAIAVLTLNRPARLNALSTKLRRAVVQTLAACAKDPSVRVVILTGAGERGFCAGQDLHESGELAPEDAGSWMRSWQDYFHSLGTFPKPIIAAVNGVAAGAGFETALLADVRIASHRSRFVMAEVDVGLPAIVGGHLLTLHLGRSRAQELVLTGRSLSVEEADDCGLVHEVVSPELLKVRALERAHEFASKPPNAMDLTVKFFRESCVGPLAEAELAAIAYQSDAIASGQPQAAMKAFFTQRSAPR